jgi:hypothetical protein
MLFFFPSAVRSALPLEDLFWVSVDWKVTIGKKELAAPFAAG